jgi:hypothetical protein
MPGFRTTQLHRSKYKVRALFQICNISNILRSTRSGLVFLQILDVDEVDNCAINRCFFACSKALFKLGAVQSFAVGEAVVDL